MKKEATISVKGRQQLNDPEADIATLITVGFLHKRLEKYYITYDETELTGMAGTKTTVRCDSGSVSVIRTGKNPSHLIFEDGKKHHTLYDTEYGQLTVGVRTDKVLCDVGERGGTVDIKYDVDIDSVYCGTNHLIIEVKVK